MINETVILLTRLEDCSEHRLAKHINLELNVPFYLNFFKALQEIFSKVIIFDWQKRMTEIGVKGVNEEVIELVRKEHPKYALWLSADYEFHESTFDMMRKEGSTVVGWFFDDGHRFENFSKWWIPHLDYCVTHDIEAVPKYKALGARVILEIPCEGTPINRDWSNIEEKYDVSFVGGRSPDRERYTNELKARGIQVQAFGMGWEEHIPFEEMMDIFGASKINLNFSGVAGSDRMVLKGRLSLVCLAGGFLLTEYVPGIENYFEIDKEIVCFKNAEEMVNKVIYYLSHDEERQAIAQAGWRRATNEYTPFHMLSRVFTQIEEDNSKAQESKPEQLKMPMGIRHRVSEYYLQWAIAFLMENYKGLGNEAMALSLRYYPFNARAWCYCIVGFLPYPIRIAITRLCRALYSRLSSMFQKRKQGFEGCY